MFIVLYFVGSALLGENWIKLFYDGYELEPYNVMEGLGLSLTARTNSSNLLGFVHWICCICC